MLKFARKRHRQIFVVQLKATDVLYNKMHVYNNEAKTILATLMREIKEVNPSSPALTKLYQLMEKADSIAIDCAHKLAPYQTPKLESIEVRNKVEHKFIIRSPQKIQSIDEWTKITGAEKLKVIDATAKEAKLTPPAPSLHDFDVEDEDQIATQRKLN